MPSQESDSDSQMKAPVARSVGRIVVDSDASSFNQAVSAVRNLADSTRRGENERLYDRQEVSIQ